MKTLPIIIPGKGRIPRIGSIGPKLVPFEVNFETLTAIVRAPYTPGAAYMNHGDIVMLRANNYTSVFEKFARDLNADTTPEEVEIPPVNETPNTPVEEFKTAEVEIPDGSVEDAMIPPDTSGTDATELGIEPPVVADAAVTDPVEGAIVDTDGKPEEVEVPAITEPVVVNVQEVKPPDVSGGSFKRITKPDDNRNSSKRH